MSEQIVDLIEAVYPGPRGLTGPQGPQGLPGVNAVNNDEAVASYIGSEGSGTASALAECWPRFSRRRFVVFGDSWMTPLAGGVCIPEEAVAMVGGSIVANYGVAGAKLAPVTMTGNCLEAQANAAAADGTVDKSLVSDVLVIMGVNNLNGSDVTYLPDEATCRNLFEGLRMYPHARYWYAADSKRCVNTDQAAWTFYQRFMQCANDAGFAAARHSPMWHWGRDDLWDSDDPGARHMGETGQRVWAARLAAWLNGQEWEPYFRVPVSVHGDLLAIAPDAYVSPGIITVDGGLLRVNVSIAARNPDYQGTGYVNALQVDRRYASVLGMGRYPMSYHEYNQSVTGDVTAKIMDRVDRCWKIDAYGRIAIDPGAIRSNEGWIQLTGSVPLDEPDR